MSKKEYIFWRVKIGKDRIIYKNLDFEKAYKWASENDQTIGLMVDIDRKEIQIFR